MQLLLVLLTLATSLCHAVIVPSRTVMPFSAVYSGVRVKSEHVTLSTATLFKNFSEREPSREWEFRGQSKSLNVSHEKFETIRALSDATLRATPGDDGGSFGTAFHIGQGYILTNQHVLSTSRSNTTQCKSLRMQTGDGKDSFDCERVVYCHREMDFCLIKMKSKKPGLFNRNPRQIQTLPTHRLRATRSPDYAGVFAAIGNPAGEGIHYSEGSGLQPYRRNTWLFFAPVHSGNSGGPLINEAGEVVGVVYAQSKYGISEDGYNMAVPLYRILEELKENIAGSEDLRFFENSLL
jgi:S1-C subfamily serine protease